MYLLMDARAAYDVDRAVVFLTGTADEICRAANAGEFGEGCIVVDKHLEPMWEWFRENFMWVVR